MEVKEINILSLFNGMSCLALACDRAGIPYGNYYSSEIDKPANKSTSHNYPNTIHLGSVVGVYAKDLPRIDLIAAGSPCQGFSNAGKGLNFEDTRSKLFFEFVRILEEVREINPDVEYLLENVRMKKEWEDTISRILGIQPILINSALVSAQNRERLYWTNIAVAKQGLFGDDYCTIPQPKDKGIYLKDVLQPIEEVDEKYYISDKAFARIMRKTYSDPKINPDKTGTLDTKNNSGQLSVNSGTTLIQEPREFVVHTNGELIPSDKANCIDANYFKGLDNHGQITMVREPIQLNPSTESGGVQPYQQNRIYSPEGIAPALAAELGGERQIMIFEPEHPVVHNMQPRSGDPKKGGTGHLAWQDGKTYCLDTGNTNAVEVPMPDKSNAVIASQQKKNAQDYIEKGRGKIVPIQYPSQADRVYDIEDKSVTLGARDGGLGAGTGTGLYNVRRRIRRLTPIEVCRLQCVPDEYFLYPEDYVPDGKPAGVQNNYKGKKRYQIVSDSQIYKMCGNGWNVDTIVHILSYSKFAKSK